MESKTLCEKKTLVTSIFFFSHDVFKRLFPPVRQKLSLCGKELKKLVYILNYFLCLIEQQSIFKILKIFKIENGRLAYQNITPYKDRDKLPITSTNLL